MRLRGYFQRRLAIIVLCLVAADQVSKYLVETRLPFHQQVDLIPFLAFFRTHNTGIAFSMLSWIGSTGLVAITFVIIALLFNFWKKLDREKQLAHLGFALVIAGAVGNLIDRLTRGHVVDFLLFHTESWAFAVFNLADAFITVGAIAIIVDELFSMRQKPSQAEGTKPSSSDKKE